MRLRGWVVLGMCLLTGGDQLWAVDCARQNPLWPGTQYGNYLNLVSAGYPWVSGAATKWNSQCDVEQIPNLQASSQPYSSMFNVNVLYHPGPNPNNGKSGTGCGWTNMLFVNGQLDSATINIYEQETSGASCDDKQYVMEHELGHLFGLEDAFETACQGNLMYGSYYPGSTVTGTECASADSQWYTDWESGDPCDYPNPGMGCDNGQDPVNSPIVLDLDGDGFHFTGLRNPVLFDLDADGSRELIGWTTGGTLEAFVVRDLNGNGRIDDGRELFGDRTLLIDGSVAANGFEALAELDLPALGGNGDGVLDESDLLFSDLLLWIDWNHNGTTEPAELLTPGAASLSRLDLRYRESQRRDRNGNVLRYAGRALRSVSEGSRFIQSVDVFFVRWSVVDYR